MPYYLSIGMTADEFWNGDPWLTVEYQRADELKRQRQSEEMWFMGLYNFNAVSTAIYNAFRGKAKPKNYLEQAIRVTPYTEEEKAAIAERERQRTIDYFNKLAKKWESK